MNDGDRRWGGIVFDRQNSYAYGEDLLKQTMVPHKDAKVEKEYDCIVVFRMAWNNWQHATFDLLPRINFA